MRKLYLILLVFFYIGCGKKTLPKTELVNEEKIHVIVDDQGRNVTLPKNPKRIIALTTTDVEILFAIGIGDKIVGIPDGLTHPLEALDIDRVGGIYGRFSTERIVGKEPDILFLTMSSWDKFGIDLKRVAKLGVPVLGYRYPESFKTLYTHIEKLGNAVNRISESDSLVLFLKNRVNKICEKTKSEKIRPKVYVEWVNSSDNGTSYGSQSRYNEIITLAGGVNLFYDVSMETITPSTEELVKRNPDVVILLTNLKKNDSNRLKKSFAKRSGMGNVGAVRRKRIYIIDAEITWANLRLIDGLGAFCDAISPNSKCKNNGR